MNKYYRLFLLGEKKINFLEMKWRILLSIIMVGITYYLWQGLIFDSMFDYRSQIDTKTKSVNTQIVQLKKQIDETAKLITTNPNKPLLDRINLLKKEEYNYQKGIAALTKQLIPPKEMTKLLENILEKDNDLTLVQMENLEVKPVFTQQDDGKRRKAKKANVKQDDVNKSQIYRHGLKIELVGTYFATQRFLKELETLPWKLLWDELHYKVTDYPFASVQIVIYTLSLQKSYLEM